MSASLLPKVCTRELQVSRKKNLEFTRLRYEESLQWTQREQKLIVRLLRSKAFFLFNLEKKGVRSASQVATRGVGSSRTLIHIGIHNNRLNSLSWLPFCWLIQFCKRNRSKLATITIKSAPRVAMEGARWQVRSKSIYSLSVHICVIQP